MATIHSNLSQYESGTVPNANGMHFGLVVAEWNAEITEKLYEGAEQTLLENGVSPDYITRINVPGSFELVYGARMMCRKSVDAVIVIGSVIRGETSHFDYVCQAVSQGIKDLNLREDTPMPVIFCVLTDHDRQQAIDRSGGKHGNKGVECAVAAIKMAALNKNMR